MALPLLFALTLRECGLLGTSDSYFAPGESDLRRIASTKNYDWSLGGAFGCGQGYGFTLREGFYRVVPFNGPSKCGSLTEEAKIRVNSDQTRFVYPALAGHKAEFCFDRAIGEREREYYSKRLAMLTPYVDIVYDNNRHSMWFSTKMPEKHIIEFDFYPHNNGVCINVIARV